jgi:DNA polymerase-3 subunit alpha
LAYQTAYLKAHYPAAFMAAVMTADMDNTDRLVTLKDDCRKQELKLVPPNINSSAYAFSVADDETISYGLGAIKGVGQAVVDAVINERGANGRFSDLTGFCRRVDHDKMNRRALDAMIKAGAMGDFGVSRRALIEQVPEALANADQAARAAAAGQNDMFGLDKEEPDVGVPTLPDLPEWPEQEFLRNEKESLGLYLTGHPFEAVRADAMAFADGKLADLMAEPPPQSSKGGRNYAQSSREVTVAGLVADIRKRGNRVSVTLDDDSARMEISLFSEAFQEFRHLLIKDEIVVVSGALRYDDFLSNWTINAKQVTDIDRVIESRAKSMVLSLAPNGQGETLLVKLHDVLLPHREGSCDVSVQYTGESASARLKLGPEWSVRPSRELRDKLTELLGSKNVRMLYAPTREIM